MGYIQSNSHSVLSAKRKEKKVKWDEGIHPHSLEAWDWKMQFEQEDIIVHWIVDWSVLGEVIMVRDGGNKCLVELDVGGPSRVPSPTSVGFYLHLSMTGK